MRLLCVFLENLSHLLVALNFNPNKDVADWSYGDLFRTRKG